MSQETHSDPLEFVRNMWSGMGFSLPGMVTPTADVDELDKRITDMKAVEGWLKMNLNMLQMTIQGLEMQHATLSTLKQMGDIARARTETPAEPAGNAPANLFTAWPWMSPSDAEAVDAQDTTPSAQEEAAKANAEAAAKAANAFANAAAAATNAAASAAMWPWQLMGEAGAQGAPQHAPKRAATKRRAPAANKKPAAKADGGTPPVKKRTTTTATRKKAAPRSRAATAGKKA